MNVSQIVLSVCVLVLCAIIILFQPHMEARIWNRHCKPGFEITFVDAMFGKFVITTEVNRNR